MVIVFFKYSFHKINYITIIKFLIVIYFIICNDLMNIYFF